MRKQRFDKIDFFSQDKKIMLQIAANEILIDALVSANKVIKVIFA